MWSGIADSGDIYMGRHEVVNIMYASFLIKIYIVHFE